MPTEGNRKRSHVNATGVSTGSSSKGKKHCSRQQPSSAKRSRPLYCDVSETVTSASSASENDDVANSLQGGKDDVCIQRKITRASRKKPAQLVHSDDECSTEKCKY